MQKLEAMLAASLLCFGVLKDGEASLLAAQDFAYKYELRIVDQWQDRTRSGRRIKSRSAEVKCFTAAETMPLPLSPMHHHSFPGLFSWHCMCSVRAVYMVVKHSMIGEDATWALRQ